MPRTSPTIGYFLELVQLAAQIDAHLRGVNHQPVLIDVVDHRLRGRSGHRVPPERGDGHAFDRVRDLAPRHGEPDRRSIPQAFRASQDIGHYAVLLDTEPLAARTAPTGLHLVA